MRGERWRRAKEVFADAMDVDEPARGSFLADACGDDHELRAEVERLIAADRRAAGQILDAGAPADLLELASHPETVGPYRILEVLGEGGMGRVYLAAQSQPVERRVALKLIKLGMGTGQVLARFEAERQALAMMEHDSIAKVFDAGTAESGQPYFVMEYVPGAPITEYCDAHRLGTRQRLELFTRVCAGVQHAHQKGVIHRDLKPSNILVAEQGGRAAPKIIDFGVAKATGHGDQAGTLLTEQGQMIGTPEYMSPEQAAMTPTHVDTRADVYALGVILYELLTGELPFTSAELRSGAWSDLQKQILEREPPTPSTRFARRGGDGPASTRKTTAAALTRELRGELDWIVMKAIEKDPERRYAAPRELARDVERYLADEPVEAGPPSTLYRLRKFVRRHRLQVIAAGAVLVTLLGGIAGTTFFMLQARARADAEAEARRDAETSLENFNRLAGVVKLADAKAVFAGPTLHPAWPDRADAMRAWLTTLGEPLARELPRMQDALRAMRALALVPTEADREGWRRGHPRADELARLQQKLATLEAAAGVRAGGLTPPAHPFHDPLPDDATGLNLLAWPLVSPDDDDREWGREAEGLALARRAWARAQETSDPDSRARAADTVAWALFACGLDAEALAMSELARHEAPAARAQHFEAQLQRLRESVAAASGERGRGALAEVTAAIDALAAAMSERRSWRFANPADQFLHDSLTQLVAGLQAFVEPEHGELARVRERLRWAETVHERTVLAPAAAWATARRALAAADGELASRAYAAHPLDLAPQLGLVPIGCNPATGLWEFAHLRSAADPDRIPRHDGEGNLEVTDATGIVFVLVPGGTFLMGAQSDDPARPNHDPGSKPHETPHGVVVEPFFLARHELTQGQWLRLSGGETPSSQAVGWDRPDDRVPPVTLAHPVEHVSWSRCQDLLAQHGLELPTEAHWEYACRAGQTTPWSSGAEPASLEGHANILDQTAGKAVAQWGRPEAWDDGYIVHAPVGSFRPNGFGLFDMHGNVWECCRGADDRPIVRGGSFAGDAGDARSALRLACQPGTHSSSIGVRAARRVTR